jgi:hypothetical protein
MPKEAKQAASAYFGGLKRTCVTGLDEWMSLAQGRHAAACAVAPGT